MPRKVNKKVSPKKKREKNFPQEEKKTSENKSQKKNFPQEEKKTQPSCRKTIIRRNIRNRYRRRK